MLLPSPPEPEPTPPLPAKPLLAEPLPWDIEEPNSNGLKAVVGPKKGLDVVLLLPLLSLLFPVPAASFSDPDLLLRVDPPPALEIPPMPIKELSGVGLSKGLGRAFLLDALAPLLPEPAAVEDPASGGGW